MSNDKVSMEIRKAIIEQELQLWQNTRFQAELRLRVQKRLQSQGLGSTEVIQNAEHQLTECEAAIMALEEELTALK